MLQQNFIVLTLLPTPATVENWFIDQCLCTGGRFWALKREIFKHFLLWLGELDALRKPLVRSQGFEIQASTLWQLLLRQLSVRNIIYHPQHVASHAAVSVDMPPEPLCLLTVNTTGTGIKCDFLPLTKDSPCEANYFPARAEYYQALFTNEHSLHIREMVLKNKHEDLIWIYSSTKRPVCLSSKHGFVNPWVWMVVSPSVTLWWTEQNDPDRLPVCRDLRNVA